MNINQIKIGGKKANKMEVIAIGAILYYKKNKRVEIDKAATIQ